MSVKAQNLPNGRIRGATWSGYPVEARCVCVRVGNTDWGWCQPYIGTVRRAIEVKLDGGTAYVDNERDCALAVFLKGHAPLPGFRFLPAFAVYEDPSAKPFYQAEP